MPFHLLYHPLVHEHDIPLINAGVRERVGRAILQRPGEAPHEFGTRLRKDLKGFWKLRIGDYRVIFEIHGHEVRIYAIMNRKSVYDSVTKRFGWTPEGES